MQQFNLVFVSPTLSLPPLATSILVSRWPRNNPRYLCSLDECLPPLPPAAFRVLRRRADLFIPALVLFKSLVFYLPAFLRYTILSFL